VNRATAVLACALAAGLPAAASPPAPGAKGSSLVALSRPVPEQALRVQDLAGRPVDLGPGLRASGETPRASLVVFWGTWCAPCLREIPVLNELKRFYGPRGLEVIGVGLEQEGETASRVAEAVERHRIGYPVYFDAGGGAARAFGITSLPAAALIDGTGIVRWMGPSLPSDINTRIQAALRPGEDSAGK
jgi:thiol-disulfide isomerase/thioredoxin